MVSTKSDLEVILIESVHIEVERIDRKRKTVNLVGLIPHHVYAIQLISRERT